MKKLRKMQNYKKEQNGKTKKTRIKITQICKTVTKTEKTIIQKLTHTTKHGYGRVAKRHNYKKNYFK